MNEPEYNPAADNGSGAGLIAAVACITGLITLVVYLPSLKAGLVNFDDYRYINETVLSRPLDAGFLKWVFTSIFVSNWHPLTVLSYKLDYSLWGVNPLGYHITNIVLHAINTALVFLLAFSLFSIKGRASAASGKTASKATLAGAAVAALLFGIHPQHVESVTWVSERKDVLYSFFTLLSLLSYVRYSTAYASSRTLSYAASLAFFIAALLSKPMAITLPFVLLILDYYPLGRTSGSTNRGPGLRTLLVEKLPFFALSGLTTAITLLVQHKAGAILTTGEYPLSMRIIVPVKGYVFYLYKTLFPIKLAPLYPLPVPGFFNAGVLVSLLVLALITAVVVVVAKRRRIFVAVWAYYLITLLPVIGIVQVGAQSTADRYSYLPGLGFLILAGAAARSLAGGAGKKLLLIPFAVVICVYGLLSVAQQTVWKDSLSLWTHEIETYPNSFRAYIYRGVVFERKKDYKNAVRDYGAAIALNPSYPYVYLDRGIAYDKLGMPERAAADLSRAISLKPDYKKAYYYRAFVRYNQSRINDAIGDLTRVIELDPGLVDAYRRRAIAYRAINRKDLALGDYKRVVELEPIGRAYFELGVTYLSSGDTARGRANLKKASELGYREAYKYIRSIQ